MAEETKGRTGAGSGWPGLPLQPLGVWNAYFILKFLLGAMGYLTLSPLGNALLLVFLFIPLKAGLHILRTVIAVLAAAALAYSESWLPSMQSLLGNSKGIAGFSLVYMLQLAWDFLNFRMIGWGLVILAACLVLKNWVRISVFTVCYFLFAVVWPSFIAVQPVITAQQVSPAAVGQATPGQTLAAASGPVDEADAIERWYQAFIDYEKDRRAPFPDGLSEKDTPFDIVIFNVCSVSDDDLRASDLQDHPVFGKFNIRFDHFNSATSYSGPATLRLLNAACGQMSHDELYSGRHRECEMMNTLGNLGYQQHLYMDHSGRYDDYLETLRSKAGLTAELESRGPYPLRYMGFNDEEIPDSLAVMRGWLKASTARNSPPRNAVLFNFIALHDGNRPPGKGEWIPFKPRTKRFLDDLLRFIDEVERSGRRVMLVVVPEHGAAVTGDKTQTARLRDIPSMRITQVPTLVKFIGLKGLPAGQIHVAGNTSYLALAALIGRTLESNFFGRQGGAVPMEQLATDLPLTNPVSENADAAVLQYKGVDWIRLHGGRWQPYAH